MIMISSSKKLLFKCCAYATVVLLSLLTFSVYAEPGDNACDLNGKWWDSRGDWDFVEKDGKLTGFDWDQKGSPCPGRYPLAGTANDTQVVFRTTSPYTSEVCAAWFDYQGTLTDDCLTITGTWVNSKGETGAFKLARDSNPYLRIISPAKDHEPFLIDAEETMPTIPVTVEIRRIEKDPSPQTEFHWTHDITHKIAAGQISNANWEDVKVGETYQPRFTDFLKDGPRGGTFTLTAEADVQGHHIHDTKTYKIHGTNPGQTRIEAAFAKYAGALPLEVIKGIACQESRYRQFDGAREGGSGVTFISNGTNGKLLNNVHRAVGMMQLLNPLPHERTFWSWRENIKAGINLLTSKKFAEAKNTHKNERIRLNQKRKAAGLAACPVGTPPPLTDAQLIRETIRRYNDGREFQWKPWDAKDCKDGKWVIDPVIHREADPGYVDNVLSCNINKLGYLEGY